MNILSIDVGHYSIKFVESTFDRKKLLHENMNMVVIHDFVRDFPVEITISEVQQEIIKEYLKKRAHFSKIIYQVPAKYLTYRAMAFPIKNRRLVQKAIPFQIEKDLLYSSKEYHYEAQILPVHENQKDNYAIASIIEIQKFTQMVKNMAQNHTTPEILTSEVSIFQNYITSSHKSGAVAILDIGHETTKSYFFYNTKLVSSHLSYVAGSAIDEIISETYMIPLEEAISFKHQKAFFLTTQQASSLSQDQQVFGIMLKKLFTPLVEDIKKWELGYRIKTGKRLEVVYLTGGTSCIKNIDNFLSIETQIPIELLDCIGPLHLQNVSFSINEKIPFTLAHLMSFSFTSSKLLPINLLTRSFAPKNSSLFPIHSISFITSRVAIVSIVLLLFLGIDTVILMFKESSIDKKSLAILKRPDLNLINREIMVFRLNPKIIFEKMKRTHKSLLSEYDIYKDLFKKSAVDILVQISEYLQLNENIELLMLEHKDGKIFAHFKTKSKEALNELQEKISKVPFKDNKIQIYEKKLTLNWEFLE